MANDPFDTPGAVCRPTPAGMAKRRAGVIAGMPAAAAGAAP